MDCRSRRAFGPLPPGRAYRRTAVALKLRHGKVVRRRRIYSHPVYLPGDDGNWVPIG
jgi:hypothetical protein